MLKNTQKISPEYTNFFIRNKIHCVVPFWINETARVNVYEGVHIVAGGSTTLIIAPTFVLRFKAVHNEMSGLLLRPFHLKHTYD